MITLGMNPQLVSAPLEFSCDRDFVNEAIRHVPPETSVNDTYAFVDRWTETKKAEIIERNFGDMRIADVKCVIHYAANNSESNLHADHAPMEWLLERLPASCAVNYVYVGENCEAWIEGDYGHFELSLSA